MNDSKELYNQQTLDPYLHYSLGIQLTAHYFFTGQFDEFKLVLDGLHTKHSKDYPFTINPLIYLFDCILAMNNQSNKACQQLVSQGIQIFQKHGLNHFIFILAITGALSHLMLENALEASQLLKKYLHLKGEKHKKHNFYYSFVQGWHALLMSDFPLALNFIKNALETACQIGSNFYIGIAQLGIARVLFIQHNKQKAFKYLNIEIGSQNVLKHAL